jgi:biopolymer transport protein TolR
MGMMMNSGGGRGRKPGRSYRPMAEINVTPFVDVMLVLLIVFMVTAPLLTVGVPVDLPRTEAQQLEQEAEQDPAVISIDQEGKIFFGETEVELATLGPTIMAVRGENPNIRVFVRGDRTIQYGRVMQVMGALNTGGFTNVALVAELPSPGGESGSPTAGP